MQTLTYQLVVVRSQIGVSRKTPPPHPNHRIHRTTQPDAAEQKQPQPLCQASERTEITQGTAGCYYI